jgi:hypothetical protein
MHVEFTRMRVWSTHNDVESIRMRVDLTYMRVIAFILNGHRHVPVV